MMYVLKAFEANLKRLGLYEAVRATCFRINISVPTFYAILEMYYSASGTFFSRRAGDGTSRDVGSIQSSHGFQVV